MRSSHKSVGGLVRTALVWEVHRAFSPSEKEGEARNRACMAFGGDTKQLT